MVDLLELSSDSTIAIYYLNSDQFVLHILAKDWAIRHGYDIISGNFGVPDATWGNSK